jgi:hypothetical protein
MRKTLLLVIACCVPFLGRADDDNTCRTTYSAWGPCTSGNYQTRTVLSRVPANCGRPSLQHSCTYVPPPAAFNGSQAPFGSVIPPGFTLCFDPLAGKAQLKAPPAQVCSQCHNPRVPSPTSNIHTRHVLPPRSVDCFHCHAGGVADPNWKFPPVVPPDPNASPTCAWTFSSWGPCKNGVQERQVLTTSPVPCTGHAETKQYCGTTGFTPCPRPACTFTYGAWSNCTSGMQTRLVLSYAPVGCVGSATSSQTCTIVNPPPPPPPEPTTCAGWDVGVFGACVNATQVRTVTASPPGCTGIPVGAKPATSQACTSPPPPPLDGLALYNQHCAGCHGTSKQGAPAATIRSAINGGVSAMRSLSFLTDAQLAAIDAIK